MTGRAEALGLAEVSGLVERAASGDVDAFAALLAPRLDRLVRTARAMLANEADARDVVQEVCVAAWVNLPRLRQGSRFDAWLNRALLNRCRDALRVRRRSREVTLDAVEVADPRQPDAGEDDVMRAFDRLTLGSRQILVEHHLHQRPVTEIAAELGIPVGTAKWRLHAARRALERELENDR